MSTDDRILSVETAAELLGHPPSVILDWIDTRGLKATPIGTVGRRGPRRYLIMQSWLMANIEAHAEVRVPKGEAPAASAAPRPAARKAAPAEPLGEKPRARARAKA